MSYLKLYNMGGKRYSIPQIYTVIHLNHYIKLYRWIHLYLKCTPKVERRNEHTFNPTHKKFIANTSKLPFMTISFFMIFFYLCRHPEPGTNQIFVSSLSASDRHKHKQPHTFARTNQNVFTKKEKWKKKTYRKTNK